MSRGFVKEGDQEDVPVVTPRAFLPEGAPNYVTNTGLNLLKAEREGLMEEREKCGDNYIMRNYYNATLALLEERISSAVMMPSIFDKDIIQFGAFVKYLSGNKEIVIRIVGVDEANPVEGKISFLSPIAKALSGHKVGDIVEISTPKGIDIVEIAEISYDCHSERQRRISTKESSSAGRSFGLRPQDDAPHLQDDATRPQDDARHSERQRRISTKESGNAGRSFGLRPQDDATRLQDDARHSERQRRISLKASESAGRSFGLRLQDDATRLQADASRPQDDATRLQDDATRPQEDQMEILPIVNERGIIIGKAQRHEVHNGSKILHPVVHLQVFNSKGELYLQKRPSWKKIQPDKWDTAVGGHIAFGEKPETALRREAMEEIGITDFTPSKPRTYIWDCPVEKELVYTFKTIYDGPIIPSDETDGGRFWPLDEIRANLGKGLFTPNFEQEFKQSKF